MLMDADAGDYDDFNGVKTYKKRWAQSLASSPHHSWAGRYVQLYSWNFWKVKWHSEICRKVNDGTESIWKFNNTAASFWKLNDTAESIWKLNNAAESFWKLNNAGESFLIQLFQTLQELRMLSRVTINCQVTKIVINPGSQLSVL